MSVALARVRLLPIAFLGRLGIAFVEITLACVFVSTSVVIGHGLGAWRAWYWDPSTTHPWAPTPAPTNLAAAACHPTTPEEQLAFARSGACVWLAPRADGTHVVVASSGSMSRDLGVLGSQMVATQIRVFSPATWSDPVLVATGTTMRESNVLVFTWQARGILELLRVGGKRVDLVDDVGGWPRVHVMTEGGMRTYRWNGAAFAQFP